MKRLRIAFVVDRFGQRWGGAEAYGVALMREMAAHHDITVFARDYDFDNGLNLNYVALPAHSFWPSWVRVWLHARLVARLTRRGFDVVHSHSNGWAGDIEVVHVTPVRWRWRARALPWFKRLMARTSLRVQAYLHLESRRVAPRAGHYVVAVSALIEQQLKQAYGRAVAAAVIAPGVDRATPDPDGHQRTRVRQALGLSESDYVGILVARNPLRKGLETAMQAYLQLPSTFRLLVVGGGPATEKALQGLQAFRQLGTRITLIPATAEISKYYRAADCCVHPTRNDSFGMVPLEAMAHGLPVILSPAAWCGFAHYLVHNQDAVLLDHPDDAEGLATAVRRLATDADFRQHITAGGYEQARQRAWPAIAAQYQLLYDQVVEAKSSHVTGR